MIISDSANEDANKS